MNDVNTKVSAFCRHIHENPALLDKFVVGGFDFGPLLNGARELGFDLTEEEIEQYLAEQFPPERAARAVLLVDNGEEGAMRELSPEELEIVGGGITYVAAVVFTAAAAVFVVVAAVGAVVFLQAGATAVVAANTFVS